MDPITNKEDVKCHLDRFYFQRMEHRKPLKAYQEGLASNPQSFNLLYEAGLTHLKPKEYESALKYWGKLLEVAPHSIAASEGNFLGAKEMGYRIIRIGKATTTGEDEYADCTIGSTKESLR